MAETFDTKNILEVDTTSSVLDSDSVLVHKNGKLQQTQISKVVETKIDKTGTKSNFAADSKTIFDQVKAMKSDLQATTPTVLLPVSDSDTVSPTSYGNIIPYKIEGFTKQETTQGLNIMPNVISANVRATCNVLEHGKTYKVITAKRDAANSYVRIDLPFTLEELKGRTIYASNYTISEKTSGLQERASIFSIDTNGSPYSEIGVLTSGGSVKIPDTFADTVAEIEVLLYADRVAGTTSGSITYKNFWLSLDEPLEEWELYTGGKASPNPDYPMIVKGNGCHGFFNGELQQGGYKVEDGTFLLNNYCVTGTEAIPCKSGDKIVIHYPDGIEYMGIVFYKKDGSKISGVISSSNVKEFSANAPTESSFFRFNIQTASTKTLTPSDAGFVYITINGKYAIGIKSEGVNLFNSRGRIALSYGAASVYNETVTITTTSGERAAAGVFFYLGSVTKFLGKKLYIKADKMESSVPSGSRLVLRTVQNGTSIQSSSVYTNSQAGTWKQSAEIPTDVDPSFDLCVQLYVGDGKALVPEGAIATFENIMVCWEKTDTYIPYQNNTTYIPIDQPLFNGDQIVYRNGEYKLIRKWETVVFDGSQNESWSYGSSRLALKLTNTRDLGNDTSELYGVQCNAYRGHQYNVPIANMPDKTIKEDGSLGDNIFIRDDSYTDAATFKSKLQENPITVTYRIKPVEEELSSEAQKALHSIMATDEQTEFSIVGVPSDSDIENQFLFPRTLDGAINTSAYATSKRNEIQINELITQNLDTRVNKLEIDNTALSSQTIVVE